MAICKVLSRALKNILYCQLMPDPFLNLVQDYSYCFIGDEILAQSWFYGGSKPPSSNMPSEEEMRIRDSGRHAAENLIPKRFHSSVTNYDSKMSLPQHVLMVKKAMKIYEDCLGVLLRFRCLLFPDPSGSVPDFLIWTTPDPMNSQFHLLLMWSGVVHMGHA